MAGRGRRRLLVPIPLAVRQRVSFIPLIRTTNEWLFDSILGSSACDGACIICRGFDDYNSTNFITLTANVSVDMTNRTNQNAASL